MVMQPVPAPMDRAVGFVWSPLHDAGLVLMDCATAYACGYLMLSDLHIQNYTHCLDFVNILPPKTLKTWTKTVQYTRLTASSDGNDVGNVSEIRAIFGGLFVMLEIVPSVIGLIVYQMFGVTYLRVL